MDNRRRAFEHWVRNDKLPLPLGRLANDERYESWEIEWAFRGYCHALNSVVGYPV